MRWPPPPRLAARGSKAHGLGNDYLVFESGEDWLATPAAVTRVCDRTRGIGSDGIVALLWQETSGTTTEVGLRMFNPDGSEFERSGNGLRVLAAHLVRHDPEIRTVVAHVGGDEVAMTVHSVVAGTHDVSVEIGRARVGPDAVALNDEDFRADVPDAEVVPVSVGNPHMVVLSEAGEGVRLDDETLNRWGPRITSHAALAAGANVQLAEATDFGGRALIWERGVGPTSASGTSACAVAVALVSTGRRPHGHLRISMPGGSLTVGVSSELDVVLRGPVEEVFDVELTEAFTASLGELP
ncbi:MAG: diaminopimelate epimerase [Gemmatimonadota bacterium]